MRNSDGSPSQRCPSRTMARNSYWDADLSRIFARSDDPGMICKQLMRKRSRAHDYRKVLWDDRILFSGVSLGALSTIHGLRGVSNASGHCEMMWKMNVGVEMMMVLGATVALAMAWCRWYYITPERMVIGSEVGHNPLALYCHSRFRTRPRDRQQVAQTLTPLLASWSTEFPSALQRARAEAKMAAKWRLEGRCSPVPLIAR